MAELQRTVEWYIARLGRITASDYKTIMADKKKDGGRIQAWHDLIVEKVTERLTGQPILIPDNYAMKWGRDHEDEGKAAYSFLHDVEVIEAPFIPHPELMAGCSPDGLIGLDGGCEFKCPANSTVHLNTWLNGMPKEHMAQIQGCMWGTDREWWDFCSYDPRMPAHLQLYVQRIERDEAYIQKLEAGIRAFLDEVDAFINKLPRAA